MGAVEWLENSKEGKVTRQSGWSLLSGALTSLVVTAAACAQGPSAKFRAQVQ